MPGVCQSLANAFLRRKQVDATPVALATRLNRCLTTFDLTLIGIGSTLGSGVYVLTGDVAKNTAGPGITASFFIAAVASVLAGICYAEFGARVPKAGSAYVYTYVTVGELAGFIVGWNLLLEYGIGSAAVAKGLSSYLDATFNHEIKNYTIRKTGTVQLLGEETYLDFFAAGFSIFVTIFISCGVKNTSRLNNVCTFSNILVIVMVITMGAFYYNLKNWDDYAPYGASGIVSGASSCFFAFIGFDVIATTGEEAAKPSRSIPIAIVGTITVCFLAYFGVSVVVTLMVPYYQLIGDSALTRAFDQCGNHVAKYIISAGALLGLTGTTIVSLMPTPRLLYSMANDGLVFKFFANINERTEVPVAATFVCGIVIAAMSLLIKLHDLIEMVSIGTLLAYTFVVISVLILRYHPAEIGLAKGVLSRVATPPPISNDEILEDHVRWVNADRAEGDFADRCKTPPYDQSVEEDFSRANLPTDKSYAVSIFCIIFGTMLITGISSVLTFALHQLDTGEPVVTSLFVVLLFALIVTVVKLSFQPQNPQELYFKVPFLPWLPFLSLFFNIYLMLSLNHLTWVRFGIWMAVGFLVYFGYGVFHSTERQRNQYEVLQGRDIIDS